MLKPVVPAPQIEIVRLTIALQPGEQLQSAAGPPAALSSDGRVLAYASVRPGSSPELFTNSFLAKVARRWTL
jgi:hypothetical protein